MTAVGPRPKNADFPLLKVERPCQLDNRRGGPAAPQMTASSALRTICASTLYPKSGHSPNDSRPCGHARQRCPLSALLRPLPAQQKRLSTEVTSASRTKRAGSVRCKLRRIVCGTGDDTGGETTRTASGCYRRPQAAASRCADVSALHDDGVCVNA